MQQVRRVQIKKQLDLWDVTDIGYSIQAILGVMLAGHIQYSSK